MAAAANSVADATQELYYRYGKQIYAYCLHQLRSREEAEDAVQTTFLNAFRGLQRGTTMRFEQAWLYKIAQNVCIARRSSSGKRLKLEAPDDFEVLQEIVPSGGTAADGDTLELMGLDEALDAMPENQRRAILLREWQGLSYREIAAELGLSQGAVEMLIFRARRTLANALEQPAEMEKRRRAGAKAGSFGSLVAAMKSLLSGGVAVKVATIAAGAAVVGTSTVHSVVLRTFDRPHGGLPTAARIQPVVVRRAAPARARVAPVRVAVVKEQTVRRSTPAVVRHRPVVAESTPPAPQPPVPAQPETPPAPVAPPPTTESPAPSAAAPPPAQDSSTGLTYAANEEPAPSTQDTQGTQGGREHGHHADGPVPAPVPSDPAPADAQQTPSVSSSTDPSQPADGAAPASAGYGHGGDGGHGRRHDH